MPSSAPPATSSRSPVELGITGPVAIWCRVRRAMGLPARMGQIVDASGWKHRQLLIDQHSLLPLSPGEAETAPRCAHGNLWGSQALASGCRCDAPPDESFHSL